MESRKSEKAIVERVFASFRDKNAVFTNFRDKNAVFTSICDKNCAFELHDKTQCLALILSVQDKINQLIANLFYLYAICFIDSQPVLSIANGFNDSQR